MAYNLSKNQQLFISAFSQATGLNPQVVATWVIGEEPQGADVTVGQNDQNWLNVGNVDSGARSKGNIWSNPVSAARATAAWMKGTPEGSANAGAAPQIRDILTTVGKGPVAQLTAIQNSPWASGHYNYGLVNNYAGATGTKISPVPSGYQAPASTAGGASTPSSGQPVSISLPKVGGITSLGMSPSIPQVSGPKGSDMLSMFGEQDQASNPSQAATWDALGSLLKSRGQ